MIQSEPNAVAPQRVGIASGVRSQRFRAEELGVSEKTLMRARLRGDLAFFKIGEKVFYSDEHISDWLSRHESRATR
jgi:hypothetical protein